MSPDDLIRTSAPITLKAARSASKPTRISILAYTGGVMDVPYFGPLVIDLAGLKPLPAQLPLLADHDTRLDQIIGHGAPKLARGQLVINGTLVTTEAAQLVTQLARDGLELRASVGVKPIQTRYIRKGETITVNSRTITAQGPLMLVLKGQLAETSIVAVGADGTTSVSIAATRGNNMRKRLTDNSPAADPNVPDTGGSDDPATIERQRAAGVMRVAQGNPEIAARAVAEGWDVQRTELEVLRASRPGSPIPATAGAGLPSGPPSQILACAALLHAGHHSVAEKSFGAEYCTRAADLRITSSIDMCRAALLLEAQQIPRGRAELIRAAFSTSTLSGALEAATEREAMTAFREAPSAWRQIVKTRPSPDFREREGLRPYFKGGRLEQVGQDGEIKHAAIDKDSYAFKVETFAKMFAVTRQTIINDDIGAIFELLQELGRQANRSIADAVAALILANPDNFFHADNNNLISGADSALAVTGLGLAVKALREQTDSDDKAIDVEPKTLLVPPALEATGRQVLASQGILIDGNDSAVVVPDGNPWKGIANLAVDARLAAEAAVWYLFADPNNVPAIVVSFLNGKEGPTVEQDDTDFNTLGRQFRCYIDYGVDDADPRGAVKSEGS
jgi:phage major head subunit gpT-like protein